MLNDADPQVQRESIRAIVQIGTNNAYAVLQRALISKSSTRETVLQELLGLRDDKAAPLLCYVLKQTQPTGKFFKVHHGHDRRARQPARPSRVDTHAASTCCTAAASGRRSRPRALRRAAASALKRIGSAEATAVLDEAVAKGLARRAQARRRRRSARALRPESKKTT